MRALPTLAVALSVAGAALVAAHSLAAPPADHPAPAGNVQPPRPEPVRGIIASCQTWGWEWGTDAFARDLDRLRALGANWVAIHPYAGIRPDGHVVIPQRWYDDPTWLKRPIREVHERGLKILIKPHLAYWGSGFRWRGEITFTDPAAWNRFFRDYTRWILALIDICRDADAFVLGTELDRTVQREADWRRLISAVRQRTAAPLTYAANWDTYQRVPFWDALDVIGIHAYFPLVDHDRPPTRRELDRAWDAHLRRLDRFARQHNRRIVFCEIGYNRAAWPARRPWDYHQGGPQAERVQALCLEAALRAAQRSDAIAGLFLWKWFVGPADHENFLITDPALQDIIARSWGGRRALLPGQKPATTPDEFLDVPVGRCPALSSPGTR